MSMSLRSHQPASSLNQKKSIQSQRNIHKAENNEPHAFVSTVISKSKGKIQPQIAKVGSKPIVSLNQSRQGGKSGKINQRTSQGKVSHVVDYLSPTRSTISQNLKPLFSQHASFYKHQGATPLLTTYSSVQLHSSRSPRSTHVLSPPNRAENLLSQENLQGESKETRNGGRKSRNRGSQNGKQQLTGLASGIFEVSQNIEDQYRTLQAHPYFMKRLD